MYPVSGRPIDGSHFSPFEPIETLYEFDGPRIFSVRDADGELNLAYWSDEDEQATRYVVVPTTPRIVAALHNGAVSVFDALNQPRCWLCDLSSAGDVVACRSIDFDAIPRDSLPAGNTLLWPDLETQLVDYEGRIRELDKDRLSFELRDIAGLDRSQRFVFDEALLADVFRAFGDNVRVKVAGRASSVMKAARVLSISRLGG